MALSGCEGQFDTLGSRHVVVASNFVQHTRKGADAKRAVTRHRDVMFAVPLRGQADVTASLSRRLIAKALERVGEVVSRDVPRKPHTAMTRSLT